MTFIPEFNAIAAVYFGVVRMEAIHGRTIVTYEDGTTHDLGPIGTYPMLLNVTGINASVDGKQLVITTEQTIDSGSNEEQTNQNGESDPNNEQTNSNEEPKVNEEPSESGEEEVGE